MTFGELKKLVAEAEKNGAVDEMIVEVPIRTYTQAYPVAYLRPFDGRVCYGSNGDCKPIPVGIRLTVAFEEGVVVVNRKKAK